MKNRPGAEKISMERKLLERLHDPTSLRAVVTAAVLLAAYLGIYMPLSSQIEDTTAKLNQEKKLLELATDVEFLRNPVPQLRPSPAGRDRFQRVGAIRAGWHPPLPRETQHAGLRGPPRDVGPYHAVVMRIELEGDFFALDSLLRWLESNPRLFRADSLRLNPSQSNRSVLIMQLTLLGVMG